MSDGHLVLVDAHVHIYDCFDIDIFLNASLNNFNTLFDHLNSAPVVQCVILLTETCDDNYFTLLSNIAKQSQDFNDQWTLHTTQEECSIYAKKTDGQGLFLMAGSQIVTAENLEVLALLTSYRPRDGMPFDKTVSCVIEHGGLPVIPWGFGKWVGRRGKILKQLLNKEDRPLLFLGDNSGRPIFWQYSPILEYARNNKIKILPGTDPLPFPRENNRPGKFGFQLDAYLEPDKPAHTLKNILREMDIQPSTYGTLENPFRFFQNQLAMQVLKRTRRD